jgi:hypothetical protein
MWPHPTYCCEHTASEDVVRSWRALETESWPLLPSSRNPELLGSYLARALLPALATVLLRVLLPRSYQEQLLPAICEFDDQEQARAGKSPCPPSSSNSLAHARPASRCTPEKGCIELESILQGQYHASTSQPAMQPSPTAASHVQQSNNNKHKHQ